MSEQSSGTDLTSTRNADQTPQTPQNTPGAGAVSTEKPRANPRRKMLLAAAGLLVLAAALWFGVPWVQTALNTVSTDDAYVNGHVTFVAARVRGQVAHVLVDDNYRVRRGDLLVELAWRAPPNPCLALPASRSAIPSSAMRIDRRSARAGAGCRASSRANKLSATLRMNRFLEAAHCAR